MERTEEAVALRPLEEIELIFQVLHHGLEWIARSPQPKAVLDVLIVKCATAEALVFADQALLILPWPRSGALIDTSSIPSTLDPRSGVGPANHGSRSANYRRPSSDNSERSRSTKPYCSST